MLKLLVTVTGWPPLSVPVAVTVYDESVGSAYVLCQLVWPSLSAPVTGSSPEDLTVTLVILPPLTAVTVMPLAGLTSFGARRGGDLEVPGDRGGGLARDRRGVELGRGRGAGLAGGHQQAGGGRERCEGEASCSAAVHGIAVLSSGYLRLRTAPFYSACPLRAG